jgi:peptidoglycan/LPS O-acetylase OafA/YrhL
VPALDGLRGVAILLVVIGHGGLVTGRHGSDAGVALFFALSGYLITGVLLERPGLGAFYLRRAARLLPALFVMLAVMGVLATALGSSYWSLAWPALLYISNWWQLAGHDMGALSHTWSLAIEEQWYLVWPFVVLFVPRRWLAGVIAAVLAGSLAARGWYVADGQQWRAYDGSDTNAFALAAGALLAVAPRTRARWWQPPGLLALVAGAGWPSHPEWAHGSALWVPVLAVTGGVLLIGAVINGRAHWLAWTPLRAAGMVSYGWYLWHYPVDRVAASMGGNGPVVGACATGVALGCAVLSWRFVEQPVLRWARSRTRGSGGHGRERAHLGELVVAVEDRAGAGVPDVAGSPVDGDLDAGRA